MTAIVGIALVNALVRVFKLFRGRRSPSASSSTTPPASRSPSRSTTPTRSPAPPVDRPAPLRKPGRGVVRPAAQATPIVDGHGGIPDLYRRRQSDVIVAGSGTIVKVLPDDLDTSDGSEQHQKFLVELPAAEGLTIKICHNLKFGRASVREGQIVHFRGEYEFNEKGGSVHWTHHDPLGLHADGFIEIEGERSG